MIFSRHSNRKCIAYSQRGNNVAIPLNTGANHELSGYMVSCLDFLAFLLLNKPILDLSFYYIASEM